MTPDQPSRRIVLVQHSQERPDNRVERYLAANGYQADIRRPYAGDPLPGPGEELGGAVIFGGLFNAYDAGRHPFLRDEYTFIERCLKRETALLGICLGAQMIALHLGAHVGAPAGDVHEFGYYEITPTAKGTDFLPGPLHVLQSHWHAFDVPAGATLLASSELYPNQAFRTGERVYGLQFHPEVTPAGFRAMQARSSGRYGLPGVQTREEQDRLMRLHDAAQADWFSGFLARLFPKKVTTSPTLEKEIGR